MDVEKKLFEFFKTVSDDVLIQIVTNDWESLERLCFAITLDTQLVIEHNIKTQNRYLHINGNFC
jgi:hypothetical protein